MGMSLVAQGVLRHHLPDTQSRTLITSLGYPVGFIVVTLGRQQLYTETTLTACLPLLHHRTKEVLVNVLRLWAVVFIGNMIGAALFAIFSGDVSWRTYLTHYGVPVFLGNSIGGLVFVSALNHAQATHGED